MSHYPHYTALVSLLDKGQFETCRAMAEELIAQQMASPQPDDRELACLLLFLSRAQTGLHDYEAACEKADIAAFLAKKLKDEALLEEALYRAGGSYVRAGEYRTAVKRFTDCIEGRSAAFRVEALYNRGLALTKMCVYSDAVPDYEAALRLAVENRPEVARICRTNLAWALILQHEFGRVDEILRELDADSSGNPSVQLQIAHDRLHIAFLNGDHVGAFKQAIAALRRAGREYPHIRAFITLTLMSLAAHGDLPQHAFTLGVLTKRLAGFARRPDLDEEASWKMQELECKAGTEFLAQSLQETGEILPGALRRGKTSKGPKRGSKAGGVG